VGGTCLQAIMQAAVSAIRISFSDGRTSFEIIQSPLGRKSLILMP
jgi:hypothetical protein